MTVPVPSLDVAAIRARVGAANRARTGVKYEIEYGNDPSPEQWRTTDASAADVPALLAALDAVSVERDGLLNSDDMVRHVADQRNEAIAERIEALHKNTGLCLGLADWCGECGMTWPCPTIAALRGDES